MKEEQQRQEAERRAQEAYEAKIRKHEEAMQRRREEAERRRREKQRIQEKLRQISPCPAGFQWYKQAGGWRCRGGSHFVSDAELNQSFSF